MLIAGQVVPALGPSAARSWIKIVYAGVADGVGWVYSPLVTLIQGGDLPVVEPPPTATPRVHATINSTMAAQFIEEGQPTRLPTFTRSATAGDPDLRHPWNRRASPSGSPSGW